MLVIQYKGYKMGSPFKKRRAIYIDVTGNVDDAREAVTRLNKAYLMSKLFNMGEDFDIPNYPGYLGFTSNRGGIMQIYSTPAASLIDAEHNSGRWHTRILVDNDGVVYGEVERPSGRVYEDVVDADMLKFLADVLTYIILRNEKGLADLLGIGMVVLSIYENETQ